MSDAIIIECDQDLTTRPELERAARALRPLNSSFLGSVFAGRNAAEQTQRFRPHIAAGQRQLPPGPLGALRASGPIVAGPVTEQSEPGEQPEQPDRSDTADPQNTPASTPPTSTRPAQKGPVQKGQVRKAPAETPAAASRTEDAK